MRFCRAIITLFLFVAVLTTTPAAAQAAIPSPEAYFGVKPGTDRELIHWRDMVKYFYALEKSSDRIRVMHMGPSTMGHPFLVLIISSPDNLANLDELQKINRALSDPRGFDDKTLESYIAKGKAVICQSMGLHSSEVGGTQSAPGIAHALVSGGDEQTRRILDNVLFFMIPCFNPDGDIMVHDWYNACKGTDHEGISMPWLYHKYIGHDTNRDGDFLNMAESRYAARVMFVEWPPQAYLDHHQMGSYGPRFYVPPYCEPIRPHADPLIWREISWYGAHIAHKLEESEIKGVINDALFPGWGHFGWHWITPFHNIAGMLTESASARLASPLYVHPEQLKGGSRQFPEYEAQSTFPSPWKGGWWRLKDIVEQIHIAAVALLDHAARNREAVLSGAVLKAQRQIQRGADGDVNAVIVPAGQHDSLTAVIMINTLMKSGIEIRKAQEDFISGRRLFRGGSFIIPLAQPKMGLIRNLLMQTRYVDNDWTRDRDGSIMRPYDLSTHTMNEFMGVGSEAVKLEEMPPAKKLTGEILPRGRVDVDGEVWALDGRLNAAYKAANMLLEGGAEIARVHTGTELLRRGDFIVFSADAELMRRAATETGVDFRAIPYVPRTEVRTLQRARTGMYRRYWGGNMDEGWTRFLFDTFQFPHTSMRDTDFAKDRLRRRFDVIVFADDSPHMIRGDIPERYRRWIFTDIPEKYRSGLGKKEIRHLKAFVEDGGRLVMFNQSWKFAAQVFDLQVTDITEKLSDEKFFCSGSTIRAEFDTRHPLAAGMPAGGLVLFTGSPVFEIV
ncbi:MAG TPA: peptidase M14 family protein, partial [Candidatus Aminicenantes bacterium]|nr:peptidase M14 family protein [Candidatus Aminicenantes bacterium]